MKKKSRVLLIVAVALLVPLYFVPIWRIQIAAPQYPDPISMYIYLDKIGGNSPSTLQNINILNHYIGMRAIEPESIPELKIMPYGLGFLIALGLLSAFFIRKRFMLAVWVGLLIAAGAVALYDFYLWEYDYGHNLDPHAPIKIPGMTYQPPFLGKKVLLNITATSLPHIGGILAILSIVIGLVAVYLEFLTNKLKSKIQHHVLAAA